jgi:Lrp/AsnC family transcriptional regulator
MNQNLDQIDRRILNFLQIDASVTIDFLAEKVHLSRNACWRRVKQMETQGVIIGRVALVDPEKVGLGLSVVVLIKTANHDARWRATFEKAVNLMPQIQSAQRMTGELDYMLRVRVANVKAYDAFYQDLISRVEISDVSASFVMQDIKDSTALAV